MTSRLYIDQTERYEQREAERRRDFIQRMERKLQSKIQASREHRHQRFNASF